MKHSLHIRPIADSDFEFIGTLASSVNGYSVPSPYVLWMFQRCHRGWSAIAISDENLLGYLLAFPVNRQAVFVWQLACTKQGNRLRAADGLAKYLRRMMAKGGYHEILFTSVPDSASERAVRLIALRVFKVCICKQSRLPRSVSRSEWEYVLKLPTETMGEA